MLQPDEYDTLTAGRHFACPEDADAYLKEKGFSRVADTTTGKEN